MFRTVINLSYRRAFTRAYSSKPQAPKLPCPPEPLKNWPTPWLEPEEVETYLFPLERAAQWRLEFLDKQKKDRSIPTLRRTFVFTGAKPALAFMKDLIDIAEQENHHPSDLRYEEGPQTFKPHGLVSVDITTHKAKISPNLLEYYTKHIRPEPPSKIKREGITLRDIRFALLLEKIFDEKYVTIEKGLDYDGYVDEPFETAQELLQHYLSEVQSREEVGTTPEQTSDTTLEPQEVGNPEPKN
ncbi:hypothetical protein V5O48_002653 [Marasmius crinis-equi]|uniref:4a-hydroxytetrahydrobiopterin dehydratase n=1 Tax=Marasmius crinis-equi TaxID=585013 RepID=A0ABR3FV43_9AGAR